MISVRNDLYLRKIELSNFIKCVKCIDEGKFDLDNTEIDQIQLKTSIKANVLIMLYNAVESTVTRCLQEIHVIINQQNLNYDQLNDHIKRIILIYYENQVKGCADIQILSKYRMEQIDFLRGNLCLNKTFDEISKQYSMFSGNLDSRKIHSIFENYGIGFNRSISELKTIKENRNFLAHGEKSFEEVGRDLSLEQITTYSRKVFEYLEELVGIVDSFLGDESYKNE